MGKRGINLHCRNRVGKIHGYLNSAHAYSCIIKFVLCCDALIYGEQQLFNVHISYIHSRIISSHQYYRQIFKNGNVHMYH